ncbi:MAG: PEP-CTERM sorting domain-containing protein [Phycisphaerales bacterium]|nr:PEP-CTERM sorting domain-containing protein [Phycisphaerales bacterium]
MKTRAITAVLMAGLATSITRGQASFHGIGFLPGSASPRESYPYGISADGTTIVATATGANGAGEPVRWASSTGVVALGTLPGGSTSANGEAYGVNPSGSVIVGSDAGPNGREAYRWTQATGMVGLGQLTTGLTTIAYGCSVDGSVVVGQADFVGGSTGQAFRWTQATGLVGLGHLATSGVPFGQAIDCSADGSVVIGTERTDAGTEAFRWTQATGMVPLGDLPGGAVDSGGAACTPDGSTIVGWAWTNDRYEPAVWRQATGWTSLGVLPGVTGENFATDCSADAGVIVGTCHLMYGGPQNYEAYGQSFIWDSTHGIRDLRDHLIFDLGIESVRGWLLFAAVGVSADGTTITGIGLNPQGEYEGWVATLGAPSCYPDCNGDGVLNLADFGCFTTKFALGCP